MTRRILIIQGHPDTRQERFCRALADAYADGTTAGGHQVRRITAAELGLTPLASRDEWESTGVPEAVRRCQDDIRWAEHLVIVYPLWLGDMPALLKAFFEQVFRPGFAMPPAGTGSVLDKLLKGRSARVVVTMGMPALIYRLYFGATASEAWSASSAYARCGSLLWAASRRAARPGTRDGSAAREIGRARALSGCAGATRSRPHVDSDPHP